MRVGECTEQRSLENERMRESREASERAVKRERKRHRGGHEVETERGEGEREEPPTPLALDVYTYVGVVGKKRERE